MAIFKFIITILTLFILTSCGKTKRLNEKDFKWIPYKGNEILVFDSNVGEIDTIFLLGTSQGIVPSDPLDIFPTKLEYFRINARHSYPSPPNENHRYLENEFLHLSASKDKSSYLSLHLLAKDAWFYGGSFLELKYLDSIPKITLNTKQRTYDDVIVILPKSDEFSDRSNFLTRVYWSKSEGLIRYDKKDTVYWELNKKYSSQ